MAIGNNLKEKLQDLPENPGVYLMKNKDKIIYVGKAKNLKNRVLSYFNREHENVKTVELVKHIEDIEFLICNSEVDALILENNLIKKYLPKYNIQLKDEKTYPYIRISREKFPSLITIRTTKELDDSRNDYFGPYPNGVWNLKKTLLRVFKIRDCNRDMSKVSDKPCLKYYMHYCTAPCKFKEVEKEYNEGIDGAIKVLKGKGQEYLEELEKKMKVAAENMEFERAILYRNQIEELRKSVINQVTESSKPLDEDYFTFKIVGDNLFLTVLSCREGKIIDKNSSHSSLKDKVTEDIFDYIFTNYYSKHKIPKNIILDSEYENNRELIDKWLELNCDYSVKTHFPKVKSRKKDLLLMSYLNLDRNIEEYMKSKSVRENGLLKLYKVLSLKKIPRRIECFDISNISGKDAVASMTVSIEGICKSKEYRKFKINSIDTPDDFQMMREVIERRYSKLKEEEFPDAILIDGGLGQINAVGKILENLGVLHLVDLLSLAKRDEEIYKYGESTPYSLSKDEEALKIFQRVRDEAHRFGITYHRKLRSKRVISSELDEISGIGPKRREVLLKKYKSVAKIKEASIEELSEIVPKNIAIIIKGLK